MAVNSAVLIDTVSIQQYVFAGNRLKENLGASELVQTAFQYLLKSCLDEVAPGNSGIDCWKNPDKRNLFQGGVKIGFIGGGNALLIFEKREYAENFIRSYTSLLLEYCPGLRTAYGIEDNFNEDNFQASMKKLHENLRRNKNQCFPLTTIYKHGITADCPFSGESLEKDKKVKDRLVSAVSYAKNKAVDNAIKRVRRQVEDIIGEKYDFTDDLGKFGQRDTRSYIAVVHADGNQMGQRFMRCKNISEIRELSQYVESVTLNAFRDIIQHAVRLIYNGTLSKETGFNIKTEAGRIILPIRPIVLGGDDITFVCEGRLAIYLAKQFVASFLKHGKTKKLSACAGVAIVKTKYPFYKAYILAEQLCTNAKQASRCQEESSYLDFLISAGGYAGNLKEIRNKHFTVLEGSLNYGPYRLDNSSDDHAINHLEKGIRVFQERNKWPRSKVMAFREELYVTKEHAGKFLTNHDLAPYGFNIFGRLENVWSGCKTPYFEMIELLDFYPEMLLQEVLHETED